MICSLIRREADFMWDTGEDTSSSDVWSRYQLLKGKYVIHPMGWDAFSLPAENYAIKMGVHPAISTAEKCEEYQTSDWRDCGNLRLGYGG